MVTPPNIELHIEELVLHGFQPGDRQRIGHVHGGEHDVGAGARLA